MARKEIKAGIGYTVGNILIKSIAFLTLPIFSRLLSTEEFGVFNTYMAYEAILAIIIGLGMYPSIRNAGIDYESEIDTYVSTIVGITVVPLAVLTAGIFAARSLFHFGSEYPWYVFACLIFHSFGTAMLAISNARLALDYNYRKFMAYAAFNAIFNVVLSIALIKLVFTSSREYGRIVGSAIPLILIGIEIFISLGKRGHFRVKPDMAKYALGFGFPMIWHFMSQQIQSQFDRIAITNIVGAARTGIYSFSYSIAYVLQVIFYSAENVWGVWFYKKMKEEDYPTIRKVSRIYMAVIAFLAIGMLVVENEVIHILGPKDYWEGSGIFIPILIGIFMLYLYTIPVGIEYYFKKTRYIAMMTIISAIVNIAGNLIFIPIYGYNAAAFTTFASYAFQFFVHWMISKKVLKQHSIVQNVFRLSDIMLILMVVIISGVAVYFLNAHILLKYVAFIIASLIALWFYRKELVFAFKEVIRKKK